MSQLYQGINGSNGAVQQQMQMFGQSTAGGGLPPPQQQVHSAYGHHQTRHQPVMVPPGAILNGQMSQSARGGGQELYQQQQQYGGQGTSLNAHAGAAAHHLLQNQAAAYGAHGIQGPYMNVQGHHQQYHPSPQAFHNIYPSHLAYYQGTQPDAHYIQAAHFPPFLGHFHHGFEGAAGGGPGTNGASSNHHFYSPQYLNLHQFQSQAQAQTMQQMSCQLKQQIQDNYLFDQPQQAREDSSEEGSMNRGAQGAAGLKRRGGAPGPTKPNSTLGAGEPDGQSHLVERSKRKLRADRQTSGYAGAGTAGDGEDDDDEEVFGEAIEKRGSSAPAKFKFFKNRLENNSGLQMQMVKLSQNHRDLDHDLMSQGKSPGIQRLQGFNRITSHDDNLHQDDDDNSPGTNSRIDSLFGELDQRFAIQKSAKLKMQHGGSNQLSEGNYRRLSGDRGSQDNIIPAELRSHDQRAQQRSNSNIGGKLNSQAINALSGIQEVSYKGVGGISFGNLIDPQQRINHKYKPRRRLSTVESEKNIASMGLRMNAQGIYEQINGSAKRKEDVDNQDDRSNHIKIEGEQTPVKQQTSSPQEVANDQAEQKTVPQTAADAAGGAAAGGGATGDQVNQSQSIPVQNRNRGESSFSNYFDDPHKYWMIVSNHLEEGNGNNLFGQPQKTSNNQNGTATSPDKDQAAVHDTLGKDLEQTKHDIQLAAYESKMNRLRIGPQGSYRKRINSGSLLTQTSNNVPGSTSLLLEDIDEGDETQGNGQKDRRRGKGINVEFLKNQFQQFTLGGGDNDQAKDAKQEEQQQDSRKDSENIEGQVLAENSKSSRKLSSSQHSNSQQQAHKHPQAFVASSPSPHASEVTPGAKSALLPASGNAQVVTTAPQSLQEQVRSLPKPAFRKPSVNLKLSVAQIAKKYGLNAGYDTMEGQRRLLVGSKREERMELFQYASVLARDQAGCRFLQQQIVMAAKDDEGGDREVLDQIFDFTVIKAFDLMVDSFGNYLIQKLVEHCTQDQLTIMIQCLEHNTFDVCRDSHGTRSIQKLIETVQAPVQFELLRQFFKKCFIELCYDINGNHVMQKILKTWSEDDNQFIYEAMNEQCVQIACHKHGCCIMQKCIDQASAKQLERLTQTIASHTLTFIVDPYANYVVQYVLQLKIEAINQQISESILKEYAFFSQQKFSSNVIEKCIEFNSQKMNQQIVRHIMIDNAAGVYPLLSHQFGNYVIQKCLQVCKDDMLDEVLESVKAAVRMLPQAGDFERKIYQRLVKKYPALADPLIGLLDAGQESTKPKQKGNQRQGGNNTSRQNQQANSNRKKGGQSNQSFVGPYGYGHHAHGFPSPNDKQNLNININMRTKIILAGEDMKYGAPTRSQPSQGGTLSSDLSKRPDDSLGGSFTQGVSFQHGNHHGLRHGHASRGAQGNNHNKRHNGQGRGNKGGVHGSNQKQHKAQN